MGSGQLCIHVDPVISHYNVSDVLLILFLQVELKLSHLPPVMSLPVTKEERANQRKINSNLPQMKYSETGMDSYDDLVLGFLSQIKSSV